MASDFWLIAGLGNPGKKYENTRHNLGFMCADVLASRYGINMSDHKGLAMFGKGIMSLDGKTAKFFLAKPLTYMNESGNAISSICSYYSVSPEKVLIIHDDMDLDFGRIKVKSGGWRGAQRNQIDRPLSFYERICARASGRGTFAKSRGCAKKHDRLGFGRI